MLTVSPPRLPVIDASWSSKYLAAMIALLMAGARASELLTGLPETKCREHDKRYSY
jgi:hypothetical protein